MVRLVVDTSGPSSDVAIADKFVIAARANREGRETAEHLIGLVEVVCAEAGKKLQDIDEIVVAMGPGSFTGLRTGLATVHGLSMGLQIPAIGISVLFARVAEQLEQHARVEAQLTANRQEIFSCLFERDGDNINAGDVRLLPKDFAEELVEDSVSVVVDEEQLSLSPAHCLVDAVRLAERFELPAEIYTKVNPGEVIGGQYIKGVNALTLTERAAREKAEGRG